MAISFVAGTTTSTASGADATLRLPTMQENDLVIVAYAIGDNDNVDFNMAMVTTGYTEVADLFANDTQDCSLGVFWKVMGSTPDTTAIVDGLGGADAAVAAVAMAFRSVDTTTPMDVTPTTATGIDSNAADPPSIDWSTAGTWTVAIGAFGHDQGGAVTVTPPTNYDTTNDQQKSQDHTSDITVAMAYRTDPADPENPSQFLPSIAGNSNHSWCASTLALRPAAEGGGEPGGTVVVMPSVRAIRHGGRHRSMA